MSALSEINVALSEPASAPEQKGNLGALDLRRVGKTYRVDGAPLEVLQGIDLRIGSGEFISLVGVSGCGKSTILRLIVGLDDTYDGEILLDGRPIAGPGLERGIVFQEHRLLPWLTVEKNLALALDAFHLTEREKEKTIREHIALVGLTGFERAYPRQLSGGMSQRAAIARGLVTRPEVLLLDEPFGALDSLTRTYMQNELLRIWETERITMVMVTHDVEEAVFLSDRIVVLSRPGRIQKVIPVDLPHPRNRIDPAFGKIRQTVLRELSA